MRGYLQRWLGHNLRSIRLQRGLSQEEFAEVLAVHRTYVGALERGERNPSLQVVERLAAALKVPAEDLLIEPTEAEPMLRAARSGTTPAPNPRRIPRRSRPRPPAES